MSDVEVFVLIVEEERWLMAFFYFYFEDFFFFYGYCFDGEVVHGSFAEVGGDEVR